MYGYGRGTLPGFLPSSTLISEKSFVSAATGAITLFQVGTNLLFREGYEKIHSLYHSPPPDGGPAERAFDVGHLIDMPYNIQDTPSI
jgi:hypothetical protein